MCCARVWVASPVQGEGEGEGASKATPKALVRENPSPQSSPLRGARRQSPRRPCRQAAMGLRYPKNSRFFIKCATSGGTICSHLLSSDRNFANTSGG